MPFQEEREALRRAVRESDSSIKKLELDTKELKSRLNELDIRINSSEADATDAEMRELLLLAFQRKCQENEEIYREFNRRLLLLLRRIEPKELTGLAASHVQTVRNLAQTLPAEPAKVFLPSKNGTQQQEQKKEGGDFSRDFLEIPFLASIVLFSPCRDFVNSTFLSRDFVKSPFSHFSLPFLWP